MYVVVREDISHAQQAVQACHAAIKASRSFLPEVAIINSPNLVVCTAPDEAALHAVLEDVHRAGIRAALFREEDMNGEATAFATELVTGSQRRVFRKLPLLKGAVLQAA